MQRTWDITRWKGKKIRVISKNFWIYRFRIKSFLLSRDFLIPGKHFSGGFLNPERTLTLSVNGKQVGSGEVGRTVLGTYLLTETFDVGQDTGTPVSKDYDRDNVFTGPLDKVVFNLD